MRFDRFELDFRNDLAGGASFGRTDELWSPRAGIVYKPVEPVSLYAIYSRSYLPQSSDQFSTLDLTAASLKPERFENVVVGAK